MKKRILITIIILFYLSNIILTGKDFYKILGVSRNATERQIKKAFRKLAKIYHPDKNPGDKQEWAKGKFSEISNAYQVLSDKKEKQKYDLGGEEALQGGDSSEQHEYYGGMDGLEDILGGGWFGGGRKKRRQTGGGRQGMDDYGMGGGYGGGSYQQPKNNAKIFKDSDVINMDNSYASYLENKIHVWAVLFWKPDDDIQTLAGEYKSFASKMKGILRIGQVNCKKDSSIDLCQAYKSYLPKNNKPGILLFSTEKDVVEPELVLSPVDMKKLVSLTTKMIPNRVDTVDSSYYKSWTARAQQKRQHSFIIFTERASTSPIVMALANDFKNYAQFAEVRSDTYLERKFKLTKTPVFAYISDPSEYKADIYTGELNKQAMSIWIQKFALKKFKTTSGDGATELNSDRVSTGPCSKTDSNLCLILVYDYANIDVVKDLAIKLGTKYSEDPINVFIQNRNDVCGKCVLGANWGEADTFLLRSKRNKFANLGYKSNANDYDGITNSIDNYLGGSMFTLTMENETKALFG